MHHSLKMYFHVNPRRSQVYQNISWRLLMEIVKDQNKDNEVVPRSNKRVRIEKSIDLDFLTYMLEEEHQTHKETELYRGSHVEKGR